MRRLARKQRRKVNRMQLVQFKARMEANPNRLLGTLYPILNRLSSPKVGTLAANLQSARGFNGIRSDRPTFGAASTANFEFVRNLCYTGYCFGASPGLMVHRSIADQLSRIARVELRPATCVGEYEVDVLDARLMDMMSARYDVPVDRKRLVAEYGRSAHDRTSWLEVVVQDAWNVKHSDSLDLNVTQEVRNHLGDDVHFTGFDRSPISLRAVREWGILRGEVFFTTPEVYDWLCLHLHPAFWWRGLWSV